MRMKISEELARQHTASYSTHMLTPLFLGKLDHKVEVGSTSFLHRYTFTHPSAFLSLGQVQLILKDSVMETVHLMTPSWVGCPYFMLSQHVLLYLSLSLSSSLKSRTRLSDFTFTLWLFEHFLIFFRNDIFSAHFALSLPKPCTQSFLQASLVLFSGEWYLETKI